MDIYIKLRKKSIITARKEIFIEDVANVSAPKDVATAINGLKILNITQTQKDCYLVSILDVIELIKKKYPDVCVNSVGGVDTVLEWRPVARNDNPIYKWIKIFFVSVVLFVGSATAVMSFYSDGQISQVFEKVHQIIFGFENKNPLIMELPYALGLTVGIILFFNHFLGKKITDDPTPIEVQIASYETEVLETLVDCLEAKKHKQEEGHEHGDR